MMMTTILVFSSGLCAADQPTAPAPVIDNGRVLVWSLQLKKGETGPYTPEGPRHGRDVPQGRPDSI